MDGNHVASLLLSLGREVILQSQSAIKTIPMHGRDQSRSGKYLFFSSTRKFFSGIVLGI